MLIPSPLPHHFQTNYEDLKVSSSNVSGLSLLLMRVLDKAGRLTQKSSESEAGVCRVITIGTFLAMAMV
jgi:hypothetical protein